ncbi:MAG: EVE domain-containing protein [Verrucomicrobia bacterium]|nr:EVE domain-containing protein [Kiritimatiellia bacterium]MCB1102706.1 EVE domain-containing protein [Kiritimatiellia bacterium]MCP5487463.1 EVE domain-containing protein [Verrucomicrobiota bacterium]
MNYWLMKTEPDVYSIEDLRRDGSTGWEGVRNYQARNFMRDEMATGDLVLVYHSNAKPPGVAGVGRIVREAHPDLSAQDPDSPYFDAKASPDNPRWLQVEVGYVETFDRMVSLDRLRSDQALSGMMVLRKGCRLSIQPVARRDFERVVKIGRGG